MQVDSSTTTNNVAEPPIELEKQQSFVTIGDRKESISFHPVKKSVTTITKIVANFCILTIKCYLLQYHIFTWIKRQLFGLSKEEKLMIQLKNYCQENKDEHLFEFIYSLSLEWKKDRQDFEELLLEVFHIREFHPHLKEIFHGANVKIIDQGRLFEKWKKNPLVYSRASSHNHKPGQCFAFSHSLFWLDSQGNTRFQLENTPLTGISNRLLHLIDYFNYIKTNEQQGILGTSKYTEDNPIVITIEPHKYHKL